MSQDPVFFAVRDRVHEVHWSSACSLPVVVAHRGPDLRLCDSWLLAVALAAGGAIMSLADTVGAVGAFLNLPEGAGTATIDSSTRLYRPLRGGTLRATARPGHVGRTIIVVNTDLTDDQGRLIAQTSQAQAVTGRLLDDYLAVTYFRGSRPFCQL